MTGHKGFGFSGSNRNLEGIFFQSQSDPAPPPPPPPPTPPPAVPTQDQAALAAQAALQRNIDQRRAAGAQAQGLNETLLTGGGGIAGPPPGTPKTLLGE